MANLGALSFFLLTAVSTLASAEICAFNSDCTCQRTARNLDFEFSFVQCTPQNGKLPTFKPHPKDGYIFNVTEVFDITADVSTIPANHFAAFAAIRSLRLFQTEKTQPKTQNWDPKAFGAVKINSLHVAGLDKMIPLPEAVKNVPAITELNVGAGAPFELAANTFASLPNLDTIYLFVSEITKIDPNAFGGLAKLRSYGQSYYPSDQNLRDLKVALNKADKLDTLSFSVTKFSQIDLATFSDIPSSWMNIYTTNSTLSTITTTNPNKFPPNSKVWIYNTEADSVDESISKLMTNSAISLVVDITGARLGPCSKANWMSRLLCPVQMVITDAQCKDGQKTMRLADYLKTVDPKTNCTNKEAQTMKN